MTPPTGVPAAFLVRMSETEFQQKIIDWAKLNGWMHYHTHNSQRSPSGFPDLVLVRPPEIIYAELKAEKKYPTPKQRIWIASLEACGQEVYLWRPSDWTEIENRLRRRRT